MPRGPQRKQVTTEVEGRRLVVSVRGKAANGEGSIYFEQARNRWRATYWVPGEARPRTVTGRSREEVTVRRDLAVAEVEAQRKTGPSGFTVRTTVAELARWWLVNEAAGRVRASSLAKYRERVERILPVLGDVEVGALRAEQVAEWQTGLRARGLAARTVADARTTLRQVLEVAVTHEVVARNVVDRVEPPKVERRPGRALAPEEVRRLVAAGADDRLGAVLAVLFVQGWRVSEVLGLAWSDLDLDAGTAHVQRAATHVDGVGVVLGPTKTRGAGGLHHLAPGVVEALRRRRSVQREERLAAGPLWVSHRYAGAPVEPVFTTPTGDLVYRQQVAKMVRRAAERAGLDPSGLGTHAGRRSVVTTLYAEEGLDLGDVARHVGHASPATTAGYVGGLGRRPKAAADAAARRLDASSATSAGSPTGRGFRGPS
jgi:integrase